MPKETEPTYAETQQRNFINALHTGLRSVGSTTELTWDRVKRVFALVDENTSTSRQEAARLAGNRHALGYIVDQYRAAYTAVLQDIEQHDAQLAAEEAAANSLHGVHLPPAVLNLASHKSSFPLQNVDRGVKSSALVAIHGLWQRVQANYEEYDEFLADVCEHVPALQPHHIQQWEQWYGVPDTEPVVDGTTNIPEISAPMISNAEQTQEVVSDAVQQMANFTSVYEIEWRDIPALLEDFDTAKGGQPDENVCKEHGIDRGILQSLRAELPGAKLLAMCIAQKKENLPDFFSSLNHVQIRALMRAIFMEVTCDVDPDENAADILQNLLTEKDMENQYLRWVQEFGVDGNQIDYNRCSVATLQQIATEYNGDVDSMPDALISALQLACSSYAEGRDGSIALFAAKCEIPQQNFRSTVLGFVSGSEQWHGDDLQPVEWEYVSDGLVALTEENTWPKHYEPFVAMPAPKPRRPVGRPRDAQSAPKRRGIQGWDPGVFEVENKGKKSILRPEYRVHLRALSILWAALPLYLPEGQEDLQERLQWLLDLFGINVSHLSPAEEVRESLQLTDFRQSERRRGMDTAFKRALRTVYPIVDECGYTRMQERFAWLFNLYQQSYLSGIAKQVEPFTDSEFFEDNQPISWQKVGESLPVKKQKASRVSVGQRKSRREKTETTSEQRDFEAMEIPLQAGVVISYAAIEQVTSEAEAVREQLLQALSMQGQPPYNTQGVNVALNIPDITGKMRKHLPEIVKRAIVSIKKMLGRGSQTEINGIFNLSANTVSALLKLDPFTSDEAEKILQQLEACRIEQVPEAVDVEPATPPAPEEPEEQALPIDEPREQAVVEDTPTVVVSDEIAPEVQVDAEATFVPVVSEGSLERVAAMQLETARIQAATIQRLTALIESFLTVEQGGATETVIRVPSPGGGAPLVEIVRRPIQSDTDANGSAL